MHCDGTLSGRRLAQLRTKKEKAFGVVSKIHLQTNHTGTLLPREKQYCAQRYQA